MADIYISGILIEGSLYFRLLDYLVAFYNFFYVFAVDMCE